MKTTSKSGSAPDRYCWSSRLAYFAARAATTDGNLQGRSEAFGDAWHDRDVLAAFQVHDYARICREAAGLGTRCCARTWMSGSGACCSGPRPVSWGGAGSGGSPGRPGCTRTRSPAGSGRPRARRSPGGGHRAGAAGSWPRPTRCWRRSWRSWAIRSLAGALTAAGHPVSAGTVARMLAGLGFSLQGNAKVAGGSRHEDRDAQFRYLNDQEAAHLAAGQPVVSIDAKKKENVGDFRNGGRVYQPKGQSERVNVHDFMDKELGKALPYGICDLSANTGWVSVGTDHDTSAFAVTTLRTWRNTTGKARYPAAARLLICAGGAGSSGYRIRAWKIGLAQLAAETGLQITVCHLPPGTSKWNKIEHRL